MRSSFIVAGLNVYECLCLKKFFLVFHECFIIWLIMLFCFLQDDLVVEKERVRNLTEEIEQTVQEIQGS